jgi:hypothetical protein
MIHNWDMELCNYLHNNLKQHISHHALNAKVFTQKSRKTTIQEAQFLQAQGT